jgi:hypothetical protein
VEPELANRLGEQAVEFMRLNDFCDWLWSENQRHLEESGSSSGAAPAPAEASPGTEVYVGPAASGESLGARSFAVLKRLSEPLYVWGLRNGWSWLVPLKERVKRRMGGAG